MELDFCSPLQPSQGYYRWNIANIVMAIHRLIEGHTFGPEEIAAMVAAFDAALTVLRMSNTDDPMTEAIARSIIAIAAGGETDPSVIADRAINALGLKRPEIDQRTTIGVQHSANGQNK